MALTSNCELYAAVHEDGVNRVIEHLMLQRPSWFNYATADVIANREQWCVQVDCTDDVKKYGSPLFTEMPPLPVIGADSPPVTLSYCVQLHKFEMDFHPGNVVGLPNELHPPLLEQRFALYFVVCGGIGCPDVKELEAIPITPTTPQQKEKGETPPPVDVPGLVQCFCLEVFVVGHFDREFILGEESIVGKVDGIEIVDVKPEGLESSIECYIKTAVTLVLRQKLAMPLRTLFFEFPLFDMGTVSLAPTANPPVPNNPAIEDDQLKAFVTMTVSP
jgi:hypothetical protein